MSGRPWAWRASIRGSGPTARIAHHGADGHGHVTLLSMRRANIFEGPFEQDEDDPPGYRSSFARVSDAIGEGGLAVKAFELASGESVSPYHYEFVEEWLIVLSGRVTIRLPEGQEIAGPGDAICFPTGPAGAHKVTNS